MLLEWDLNGARNSLLVDLIFQFDSFVSFGLQIFDLASEVCNEICLLIQLCLSQCKVLLALLSMMALALEIYVRKGETHSSPIRRSISALIIPSGFSVLLLPASR